MTAGYPETVVSGVLISPFVGYALAAFAVYLLLVRPVLRRLPMQRTFVNPPLIGVCLWTLVLAALIVLF